MFRRMTGMLLILTICFSVLTFSSCGKKEEAISRYETRQTVKAIEGKDYRIDDIVVAIADNEGQNGDVQYVSYDELRSILETKKSLGEVIHCRVTVKYTALNELATAKCSLNLCFWSFEGDGDTITFSDVDGNTESYNLLKTKNIMTGEHYLSFSFSILNKAQKNGGYYVIENLDTIDEELFFEAFVYVD